MFFLVLSALISLMAAGTLYYTNIEKKIMTDVEKRMDFQIGTASDFLATFIAENLKTSKALARMEAIKNLLKNYNENNLIEANKILNIFKYTYEVDICYLLDKNGDTIASSESSSSESFIGNNYSFRPYFQMAIKGEPYVYMGLGITSNQRGVYYSQPVLDISSKKPIGVVVTKNKINNIETKISVSLTGIWMLVDPNGMIFASNIRNWRIKLMWPVNFDSQKKIAETKQFGNYPWENIKIEKHEYGRILDKNKQCYLIKETNVYNFPHWKIYYLTNINKASQFLTNPLHENRTILIFVTALIIGIFIILLYFRASSEFNKKKKMKDALQSQNGYLLLLHETAIKLVKRLNVEDLVENILYRAGTLTNTMHGFLILLEADNDKFVFKVGFGKFSSIIGTKISINEGLSGEVFKTQNPTYISDYSKWSKRITDPFFDDMKSIISAPLKRGNNVIGIMGLAHFENDKAFALDEMDVLEKFAQLASVAYDNANLYTELQLELKERKNAEKKLEQLNKELERLAVIDGLTQLANRRKFDDYLNLEWRRMAREKKPLSLILCDVDFFKQYNDYYGHLAGDDCLKKIAEAISNNTKRTGDLAARYGGEEFGIILSNTPIEGAFKLCTQICEAIRQLKIEHKKSTISSYVTISAGISCLIPDNDIKVDVIIDSADKALYQAKENGRNQAICQQI